MKQCDYLSWLVGGIAVSYLTMTSPIQAQINPDGTLPNNSSVKTRGNTKVITEGTRAGGNLFHSFEQFSIPTDGVVFFNNTQDIQNIISRVTGESVSNIYGSLKANGAANLFLLNPNGIIFGPNASLNIGGSFLASTASSLKFTDGKEFSATEPQTALLLSVNVPVGLQFGAAPGGIRNQSRFQLDPTAFYPVGLQVKPGKTLALVGSNIALEGGYLTAAGGRIEVGSVAGSSLVSLNPTKKGWSLSYDGVKSFQDIQLSKEAYSEEAYIESSDGGDIQVQGKRITLAKGSQIAAFTQGTPGGTLTVTASESVELIGVSADGSFPSALLGGVEGLGDAINVKIDTKQLIIQGGAQVSTTSEEQRGDLTVTASESVKLVGTSADGVYKSGLFTDTKGAGDAGDLTIETGRLLVRDGARAISETSSAGQGGDLTVTASESVELVDVGRKADGEPLTDELDRPFVSGLFSRARKEATGPGGNLSIFTNKLIIKDGAQANSTTLGTNNAGKLTVRAADIELAGAVLSANGQLRTTEDDLPVPSGLFAGTEEDSTGDGGILDVKTARLSLRDGAVLQTSTFSAGDAGDLKVQASESVELIGTAKGNEFPTSIIALSGGFPDLGLGVREATGKGGDLKVTTGNLLVQNGAEIAVSSINPTGAAIGAGRITIAAPTINLDSGDITSTTASGNGGNITIQVPNVLLLRRNSDISTSAGSAETGGDGGNIEIDTNSIVAVPLENSDITANAFEGSGGDVDIEVQGDIFGLEPRSRQELQELLGTDNPSELNPDRLASNDITAISQTNPSLSGDVIINPPDVDPDEGVVALPDAPVNVEVAQGCQAGTKQASVEFFNTGKGGLAPNPYEPLSSSQVWEDVPQRTQNLAGTPSPSNPTTQSGKIVEAQGWLVNEKGEAVLVAEVPTTRSQRRCHLR